MHWLILVTVIMLGVSLGLAQDSPLLSLCLRGSDNPEEVEKSKHACTAYLANLMQDLRFGTSTERPFCLPSRDLTAEEHNLIFKKFSAENPRLPEMSRLLISALITTKADRCSSN